MEFGKFSEIQYVRPDFKKASKDIKQSIAIMKKAANYEEFKKSLS